MCRPMHADMLQIKVGCNIVIVLGFISAADFRTERSVQMVHLNCLVLLLPSFQQYMHKWLILLQDDLTFE